MENPVNIPFFADHPWLRLAVIATLLLVAFAIGVWLYVGTTLPVLGRMVDARTGKPIEGSVCESIEYAGWGWTTRTLHFDTFSRNGWFYLGPHFGTSQLGHWIVFNDPSGQCRREVGVVDFDFNDITHTLRTGGYFPVVLEQDERYGLYHSWPATWRIVRLPLFVTVPIIPRLKDVGECAALSDSALQEQCRQLNTYLASMESIAAGTDEMHVSHALEMCDQLDPKNVRDRCERTVKSLSALDAAKRAHDAAVRFAHERDFGTNNVALVPIEELFPETVSGIPRTDWDITENGIGTGRAGFSAQYASDLNKKFSASMSVYEFRDVQHARDGLKELCVDFTKSDVRPANGGEESREYVLRRRTKPLAVCWLSEKRVVQIEFLSGTDDGFVEAFLRKFSPR